MMSFAIPAVWAGVNFSNPAIRTGSNFPDNSICGGRPGLNIRSLTLSEALNICLKTAIKFGGGGPALCGVGLFGCSLLIFHSNFLVVVCVKSSSGQTQLQK